MLAESTQVRFVSAQAIDGAAQPGVEAVSVGPKLELESSFVRSVAKTWPPGHDAEMSTARASTPPVHRRFAGHAMAAERCDAGAESGAL